jgi:hypothetical protein
MGAVFEFASGGISVMPDPGDNPGGHGVPHTDSGVLISFKVRNIGDESRPVRVQVTIDDQFFDEWQSDEIVPGGAAVARISIGRFEAGTHWIHACVISETGESRRPVRDSGPSLPDSLAEEPLTPELIQAAVEAFEKAVRAHVPYAGLADAVRNTAPGAYKSVNRLGWDTGRHLDVIRRELTVCRVIDDSALREEVWSLQRRLGALGNRPPDHVVLSQDSTTGRWWTVWEPPDARASDVGSPEQVQETGRIVAIQVDGSSVGHGRAAGEQRNVFVHTVESPGIDFGRVLGDSAVAAALAALARDPANTDLREAAADAVAGLRPQSRRDWNAAYSATGAVARTPTADALNGTVAVIRSRAVEIGDHSYQENTIVCALSPTIDAAAVLIDNRDLVNGLIDIVCSGAGAREVSAFEDALGTDLTANMDRSPALRDKRGVVERPAAAGQTLRVRRLRKLAPTR